MKKSKLVRRLLFIFISMTLVILACISMILYLGNRNEITDHYSSLALSHARAGAEYIDGDRVSYYLNTGVIDDYYKDIQKFLDLELQNSDLEYYYVMVPCDDDFIYIWDNISDNSDTQYKLGVHEGYDEYAEDMLKASFSKDPEIKAVSGDTELYGSLISLAYPLFDSAGEPVALVCADISTPDLHRSIYRALFTLIICLIPLILIVISVVFWYLRRHLIKPILSINDAAKDMVEGINENNDLVIPVNTDDEIEDLAHSLEKMSRELKDYIVRLSKATIERERVEAELSVAARIQTDLIPSIFPAFPDREEFDLSAGTVPAKEVGGDLYDFFMVDNDHLALVVADVSDKGIPAAMVMVIAQTLVKNAVQSGLSPKDALFKINNQLNESDNTGMFVSMWLGILTISDGTLVCSNAGHEYPIIGRRDGGFALFHDKHCFVLAGLKDTEYEEYELSLSVGDTLFIYTDGVTESINSEYEQFGTDRILEALNSRTFDTCREQITEVFHRVENFENGYPQYDDITMLSLKIKKMEKSITTANVTPDRQPELTEFAENTFRSWQVPQDQIIKMNIILDELYSNIANYSGADEVKMTCAIEKDEITLTFEDNGVPFDPTKKEDIDITQTAEKRKVGGLGIFIVKKSTDRMEYRYADGKNILTVGMKLQTSQSDK